MAYTPQIYYPSTYQPQFQNYQPMQQQIPQAQPMPQPQQTNQGLIWVSGEVGAKSYLMAPSSTVMLMDSERESFYIKSTDNAGMPTIRVFDYKERVQSVPQNAIESPHTSSKSLSEQFVTREEYEAICGKYEELQQMVADLQKPKTTAKRKEVNPDE